jgi:hypothetical protein
MDSSRESSTVHAKGPSYSAYLLTIRGAYCRDGIVNWSHDVEISRAECSKYSV